MYKLEGKILRVYRNKRSTNRTAPYFNTAPSIELDDVEQWTTYYNGTSKFIQPSILRWAPICNVTCFFVFFFLDTSWIINGLNEKNKYAFRVSALNSYGWSNVSEESNEFDLTRMADKQSPMKLILIATLVPVSICLFFMTIFIYCEYKCLNIQLLLVLKCLFKSLAIKILYL